MNDTTRETSETTRAHLTRAHDILGDLTPGTRYAAAYYAMRNIGAENRARPSFGSNGTFADACSAFAAAWVSHAGAHRIELATMEPLWSAAFVAMESIDRDAMQDALARAGIHGRPRLSSPQRSPVIAIGAKHASFATPMYPDNAYRSAMERVTGLWSQPLPVVAIDDESTYVHKGAGIAYGKRTPVVSATSTLVALRTATLAAARANPAHELAAIDACQQIDRLLKLAPSGDAERAFVTGPLPLVTLAAIGAHWMQFAVGHPVDLMLAVSLAIATLDTFECRVTGRVWTRPERQPTATLAGFDPAPVFDRESFKRTGA